MKIIPKEGFILASSYEMTKEKKSMLILKEDEKFKGHLKVETNGLNYSVGQIIFVHPYKHKIEVEENLFLIAEEDVLAVFEN